MSPMPISMSASCTESIHILLRYGSHEANLEVTVSGWPESVFLCLLPLSTGARSGPVTPCNGGSSAWHTHTCKKCG